MRSWGSQQHSSTNRTPTACPVLSSGRCRKQKTLSLLSCQRLWSPAMPKGSPCHPHPLQYCLHQMLAMLRNRIKNSLYNESVLRITWANSPRGEDTAREAPPPPTSQASLAHPPALHPEPPAARREPGIFIPQLLSGQRCGHACTHSLPEGAGSSEERADSGDHHAQGGAVLRHRDT